MQQGCSKINRIVDTIFYCMISIGERVNISFPIETKRLYLRPFQENDLEDLYAYYSLPEIIRYLFCEVQDKEKIKETLATKIKANHLEKKNDKLILAVELKSTKKVIGEVMLLWKSKKHQSGEIGYVFNPAYHGQGYATEAAKAMLKLGFEQFNYHRMFARCDARNTASANLMERLGMRREAHLIESEFFKGEWASEFTYAILQDEWGKVLQ
jgi:RimJ/RimL family protein N-acetyltransferase